jgi:hypothetical protein
VRRAARRDATESAICEALDAMRIPHRRVSCEALGDLEVVVGRRNFLVEVKTGTGGYTPAQIKRREWLDSYGVDLALAAPTWRSVDGMLEWVQWVRK